MPAKGSVEADAAMTNQGKLELIGLPNILCVTIGEITRELITADLADQTRQSTGQVKATEVEIEFYLHHEAERIALELWWLAAVSGAPLHKLPGFLTYFGADGKTAKSTYAIVGAFPTKMVVPAIDLKGDGEAAKGKATISIDMFFPA